MDESEREALPKTIPLSLEPAAFAKPAGLGKAKVRAEASE
jgi:hypothetical protein